MKQAKKKTEKNQPDTRDDKLALMVQRGFLEMNDKFLEMNDKFNDKFIEVNKNINQVREELSERIGGLEERMDKVEYQLTGVLDNQDKIMKDLKDLKEENTMDIVIHGRLEKRITHLEREMAKVKVKVKV